VASAVTSRFADLLRTRRSRSHFPLFLQLLEGRVCMAALVHRFVLRGMAATCLQVPLLHPHPFLSCCLPVHAHGVLSAILLGPSMVPVHGPIQNGPAPISSPMCGLPVCSERATPNSGLLLSS